MSLLYKDQKDVITSVEITQDKGVIKFEFSADCGKFGTDEPLAEFEITPKELLELLTTTSPIEFDAKKVAEDLYENWGKYLQVTFGVVNKIQLKAILIKHLDNNTTYTSTQRQQILNELNNI